MIAQFLWLSPATLSIPPKLKYFQLKLELQESQKIDKKDNSKTLFCETTFISCFAGDGQDQVLWWFALIRKFLYLRERRVPGHFHFEFALLALRSHDLSI